MIPANVSYRMSKVASKNTKPEMLVRKFLFSKGLRYRIHNRQIIGNPDIAITKYKIAIFINGCFWHGHKNCNRSKIPKSNPEFWMKKMEYNSSRDSSNAEMLVNGGWNVLVIWECELKKQIRSHTLNALYSTITEIRHEKS